MAISSLLQWFDIPNAPRPSVGTQLGILTDIP